MILVMSGTKDGRALIQALSATGYDIIATTTTAYGASLIEQKKGVRVMDQAMDLEALVSVIQTESVEILVDATHPYAVGASENAMAAAKTAGIAYVRYERENLEVACGKWFATYEEMIAYLSGRSGNVLLTIGANNLKKFTDALPLDRLYARVLPMSGIIEKCESYGLKPKNILGVQGPFSKTYNMAMIEAYDIKYLVSKATSTTGGFDQKVLACEASGAELLVLERPQIDYEAVYSTIGEVVNHVSRRLMIDRA
ncbi:MAG: precorrin-6A reductase [Clostridia bacterium]|nr:precorrin-6A reductase [Clostridia bacterium]